jgi:HlyD family secretion protein
MQRVLPIALLLVGLIVLGLWWSQRRTGPALASGVLEAEEVRLGSRVGGRVKEVLVQEGDRVRAGQALVTLEPFDLLEQLASAKADLAAREAVLARLEAGFRSEEVAQARARRDQAQALLDRMLAGMRPLEIQMIEHRLAIAEAGLRDAQRELDRIKPLFERGQATPDEMERAVFAHEAQEANVALVRDELSLAREGNRAEDVAHARALLAESEAAFQLVQAGSRAEDVEQARALVRSAESTVEAIRRQLEELRIVAPRDGRIEALELYPGDLVAPNAQFLTLLDERRLWVRAYVPQAWPVTVGQRLTVRVDAFPRRHFAAHVTFVAQQAEFIPANVQTPEERSKQVFHIRVMLDEGYDVLRTGMAADVLLDPSE